MDALGGRTMLLVSFAASALCYGITASATSLTALYISRCGRSVVLCIQIYGKLVQM